MNRPGIQSTVYHGDACLGEAHVFPTTDHPCFRFRFQFPNNEIRITHLSPRSRRCPPLSVLHAISPFSVPCKIQAKPAVSGESPLSRLHASCFHESMTAVVVIGDQELHLVAMPSRESKSPCFWVCSVRAGLYGSCMGMINLRCLAIVFDLDETLVVANTMRSFEDRIEALSCRVDAETDLAKISGMCAELKRYIEDRDLLKQYVETDTVMDDGRLICVQNEEVPPVPGSQKNIVRPIIRLPQKNVVLTRINPEVRDTSVFVRLRPFWDDLRSYLTAKGRKRFEVYVCTMSEREYALEMWRLLDPEAQLISSKQLLDRIICVRSGSRKSLVNVFQDGVCHPRMAMVVDDRLQVWDEKDHSRILVVPAFTPYYSPQAEMASAVPILCVARNVACNVRGGFFKEFDENLLPKISGLCYENDIWDLPYAPDASDYLMQKDTCVRLNCKRDVPISEGMTGVEVERRLNQPTILGDGRIKNEAQSTHSFSVLQEIDRRCDSKVEFRSIVGSSKDVLPVEVLFSSEKIGIGMGRTRKEAQVQAAESALHNLARNYMSYIAPKTEDVDAEVDTLSVENENGFLWDIVSPTVDASSKKEEFPSVNMSEHLGQSDDSERLLSVLSVIKDLCTEDQSVVFIDHAPASVTLNKGEYYFQVEVVGEVLGKGVGVSRGEAKLQAAEEALRTIKAAFNPLAQKRLNPSRTAASDSANNLHLGNQAASVTPSSPYENGRDSKNADVQSEVYGGDEEEFGEEPDEEEWIEVEPNGEHFEGPDEEEEPCEEDPIEEEEPFEEYPIEEEEPSEDDPTEELCVKVVSEEESSEEPKEDPSVEDPSEVAQPSSEEPNVDPSIEDPSEVSQPASEEPNVDPSVEDPSEVAQHSSESKDGEVHQLCSTPSDSGKIRADDSLEGNVQKRQKQDLNSNLESRGPFSSPSDSGENRAIDSLENVHKWQEQDLNSKLESHGRPSTPSNSGKRRADNLLEGNAQKRQKQDLNPNLESHDRPSTPSDSGKNRSDDSLEGNAQKRQEQDLNSKLELHDGLSGSEIQCVAENLTRDDIVSEKLESTKRSSEKRCSVSDTEPGADGEADSSGDVAIKKRKTDGETNCPSIGDHQIDTLTGLGNGDFASFSGPQIHSSTVPLLANPASAALSSTVLFVACLPQSVNEDKLKELFLPFGQICEAKLIMDKSTGLSKGYGFVEYADAALASEAAARMNGYRIEGRMIAVQGAGRPLFAAIVNPLPWVPPSLTPLPTNRGGHAAIAQVNPGLLPHAITQQNSELGVRQVFTYPPPYRGPAAIAQGNHGLIPAAITPPQRYAPPPTYQVPAAIAQGNTGLVPATFTQWNPLPGPPQSFTHPPTYPAPVAFTQGNPSLLPAAIIHQNPAPRVSQSFTHLPTYPAPAAIAQGNPSLVPVAVTKQHPLPRAPQSFAHPPTYPAPAAIAQGNPSLVPAAITQQNPVPGAPQSFTPPPTYPAPAAFSQGNPVPEVPQSFTYLSTCLVPVAIAQRNATLVPAAITQRSPMPWVPQSFTHPAPASIAQGNTVHFPEATTQENPSPVYWPGPPGSMLPDLDASFRKNSPFVSHVDPISSRSPVSFTSSSETLASTYLISGASSRELAQFPGYRKSL